MRARSTSINLPVVARRELDARIHDRGAARRRTVQGVRGASLERGDRLGSILPEPFMHPMDGDASSDELRSWLEPVAPLPDHSPVVRLEVGETKPFLCCPRHNSSASIVGHRETPCESARRRGGRPGGVGVRNRRPSEASLPQGWYLALTVPRSWGCVQRSLTLVAKEETVRRGGL
jgi:hypothetical protein